MLTVEVSASTVRRMKTIPLRQLVRAPRAVKKWTRAGQTVQVTDNGKPLWLISPAANEQDKEQRAQAIDEVLDEVLQAPRSKFSLSESVLKSRR